MAYFEPSTERLEKRSLSDEKIKLRDFPPPNWDGTVLPKPKKRGFFQNLFRFPFEFAWAFVTDSITMLGGGLISATIGIAKLLGFLGLCMLSAVVAWYLFVVVWTWLRINYIG